MPANSLAGYRVLITRPEGSSEKLAHLITAQGGLSLEYPVLKIVLEDGHPTMQHVMANLSTFDLAVFVSVHAVRSLAAGLQRENKQLPQLLKIAAIGPTTAAELESHDYPVHYLPRGSVNSEGLIGTFGDLKLSGRKVVIFGGQSGRGILQKYLSDVGAKVKEVESYRRMPNPDSLNQVLDQWLIDDRRLLTLTSVEVLQQLLEKIPATQRGQVLRSDVAALSERIAQVCVDRGFTGQVSVAESSDAQGLLDALIVCVRDDRN
jgi:uroporphyrinogen-III synthase